MRRGGVYSCACGFIFDAGRKRARFMNICGCESYGREGRLILSWFSVVWLRVKVYKSKTVFLLVVLIM